MSAHAVFISYHRSDAEIARRIRDDLTLRGAATWMDEFDIPPGAYWPDEIDKALASCTAVVGVLSPEAIASRNVKNEWDWALFNDRPLLLVLVHPCTVPHRYISLNWIDASQVGLDSALELLASAAGLPTTPLPDSDRLPLPMTRYTRSGDGNVAWQLFGNGPIDLVLTPGAISHLEHNWTIASRAAWLRRLGTLARVVTFDKRGTGLSDRVGRVLTLEERADDIRAVMDAAGFERAVIFGISDGGSLAAFFAANYPERTIGLMIYGGLAPMLPGPTIHGLRRMTNTVASSKKWRGPCMNAGELPSSPGKTSNLWRLRARTAESHRLGGGSHAPWREPGRGNRATQNEHRAGCARDSPHDLRADDRPAYR